MNTNETIMPERDIYLSISETIPPCDNWMNQDIVSVGNTIGSGFIVIAKSEFHGRQAEFFDVKKSGKNYLLKVYYETPADEVIKFVKQSFHDNITEIIENGFLDEKHYYEVMKLYRDGNLDQMDNLEVDFIKKVVVPSINNGLHFIHERGFLHLDIKPSNIYASRQDNIVVIGDFGSAIPTIDGRGTILDIQGKGRTPEYSIPVRSSFGITQFDSSYDYASFGLLLFKLFVGYSYFGALPSPQAISEKYFSEGIKIPENLDDSIKEILYGLLNEDEKKRWGYKEVVSWSRKILTVKKAGTVKLVFAKIGEDALIVDNIKDLADCIRKHWKYGRNLINRIDLKDFIRRSYPSICAEVETLIEKNKNKNPDIALFKFLYLIDPTQEIYFKDKVYPTIESYFERLRERENDAVFLWKNNLYIYYLRRVGVDENQVNQIQQVMRETEKKDYLAIEILCKKIFNEPIILSNMTIENLEQFIDTICKMDTKSLTNTFDDKRVLAWLYKMGVDKKILRLGENI